jgi:hypothetical protein
LLSVAAKLALTARAGLWENVLQPALEVVWQFIKEKIIPIFEDIVEWINDKLGPPISWLADKALAGLKDAFDAVKKAVGWLIDKIKDFIDALKGIELPDWLTPGSPTPFEMGLRGIIEQMGKLERITASMPIFNMGNITPAVALAGAENSGGMGASSYTATTTIYTNRDPLRVLHASRHLDKLGRLS